MPGVGWGDPAREDEAPALGGIRAAGFRTSLSENPEAESDLLRKRLLEIPELPFQGFSEPTRLSIRYPEL